MDIVERGERAFNANLTGAEVYAQAAALYVALVKNGYFDEAAEFAEWFLETFDLDLEN